MILESIEILDFKNIESEKLEFSPGVNCLLGMNGMGKTNLLDAIHFLCMTRPMAPLPDSALARHGSDSFMAKGTFRGDDDIRDTVAFGFSRQKGKTLKRNGKEYGRISEHIGRYPVVTVTPADTGIITGPAEERRKLIDMVISQASPQYLSALMQYNKALAHRNSMLRSGVADPLLYESVEAVMCAAAGEITAARRKWTESTAPGVAQAYARISGAGESVALAYRSRLDEAGMQELLDQTRGKDTVLGHTSTGPHRDDFEASLGGYSLRRLGSQGQVKTFSIALRFAIFNYLRKSKGTTPLLLLDDIFDKLDASRVENIMREVSGQEGFGQIFITDTNRRHLDGILEGIGGPKMLISVENGHFSPIQTL